MVGMVMGQATQQHAWQRTQRGGRLVQEPAHALRGVVQLCDGELCAHTHTPAVSMRGCRAAGKLPCQLRRGSRLRLALVGALNSRRQRFAMRAVSAC